MLQNCFPEFDALYSGRHVLYNTTRHGILEDDDFLTHTGYKKCIKIWQELPSPWRCSPTWATVSLFLRFLDYKQRRTTAGWTSGQRKELYGSLLKFIKICEFKISQDMYNIQKSFSLLFLQPVNSAKSEGRWKIICYV